MTSTQIHDTDMALRHETTPQRSSAAGVQAAGVQAIRLRAASLLADLDLGEGFTLTQLSGGANNQVFRVDASRGQVVLKAYYEHEGDHGDGGGHDRLGTEYAFLSFASAHGIRCVPRPLACDRQQNMAAYELVPGRRLAPEEVDAAAVDQAIAFYRLLNRHKHSAAAAALPDAAEASYTIGEHLACVERRLERLLCIEPTVGVSRDAVDFVRSDLRAAWVRVSRIARRDAARHGLSLDQPIAGEERCLSPSDFGFHNALTDDAAELRFIDFEYAGWDDPAKLVCDFFCQPAAPAPRACFENFAEGIASGLANAEMHLRRFRLLLPVYGIKWCCILLNDFLPAGNRRREFALAASQQHQRHSQQLQKARTALQQVA
jgi:Phosphotransferase enzyme family